MGKRAAIVVGTAAAAVLATVLCAPGALLEKLAERWHLWSLERGSGRSDSASMTWYASVASTERWARSILGSCSRTRGMQSFLAAHASLDLVLETGPDLQTAGRLAFTEIRRRSRRGG